MNDLYYRPSGQAPVTGLILGILGGGLGGLALAIAYAYAILYIPIAGYVTFLLALGFGGATGFATGLSLRHGRVRNPGLAYGIGTLVALAAFYIAWLVWVFAFLRRANAEIPLTELLIRPRMLWAVIVEVNSVGAWSIHGGTPTGLLLWGLWLAEALLILVPAVVCAALPLADPFCEMCERWCEERKAVRVSGVADKAELLRRMEAKEWAWIATLGTGDADAQLSYDLHVCPSCEETHTLTVNQMTTTIEDGKRSTSTNALLERLLITRADAKALHASPLAPPSQSK